MNSFNRFFPLLFGLLLLTAGCASIVRISDIKAKPRDYHDKVVTLSGYVDEVITLPVLGVGLYQLDDGTDKIWVKPDGNAPYQGDRVKVTGEIKVGMTISGRTFGLILIEQKKLEDN